MQNRSRIQTERWRLDTQGPWGWSLSRREAGAASSAPRGEHPPRADAPRPLLASPSESRHTCHSHRSMPDTSLSHDHNNHTLFRRMRLRHGSLRIHGRPDYDASLSLSRLPAIQRRSVLVFRHRADGSFQALARLTTLPCLAQSDGWQDPSWVLP
jgi:hypothetical protein